MNYVKNSAVQQKFQANKDLYIYTHKLSVVAILR